MNHQEALGHIAGCTECQAVLRAKECPHFITPERQKNCKICASV